MRSVVLAVLLAAFLAAPAQAGVQYVHAHRGGPLSYGAPENSLQAFERTAADGFVVELDVKLSKDRVPVVIHDATLDRTTTCKGRVIDRTAAELRSCTLVESEEPSSRRRCRRWDARGNKGAPLP